MSNRKETITQHDGYTLVSSEWTEKRWLNEVTFADGSVMRDRPDNYRKQIAAVNSGPIVEMFSVNVSVNPNSAQRMNVHVWAVWVCGDYVLSGSSYDTKPDFATFVQGSYTIDDYRAVCKSTERSSLVGSLSEAATLLQQYIGDLEALLKPHG